MSVDLFNLARMSSRSTPSEVADRLAAHAGITIAEARRARRWTLRELATRAGLSVARVHAIEHGQRGSLETYAALALALNLEPRLELVDPRRKASTIWAEDPIHAAMGEVLASRFASFGFAVAIDEPYQHFQFAGRADVLVWDLPTRSLLHVENRTRFPNLQEAIGSYNAKRRYLPAAMAARLGLRGGFDSVTNVIAGLWSSEVLHVARIRAATFAAVCPDPAAGFGAWWSGVPPPPGPPTSAMVLLDPIDARSGRRPRFAEVDVASRPRYHGYADALQAIGQVGGA